MDLYLGSQLHKTVKHLPLFLAVLHQYLLRLKLTSTNRLIVETFKHCHCFFYFLYQFFFSIKQTNVVLFLCLWRLRSPLKIALSFVHAILHKIFYGNFKNPPGFLPWFLTRIPLTLFLFIYHVVFQNQQQITQVKMELYCHDMTEVIALQFLNLYYSMLYRVRTSSQKILSNLLYAFLIYFHL